MSIGKDARHCSISSGQPLIAPKYLGNAWWKASFTVSLPWKAKHALELRRVSQLLQTKVGGQNKATYAKKFSTTQIMYLDHSPISAIFKGVYI